MKIEPSTISRTALAAHAHLRSAYSLPITASYHATACGGEQYFRPRGTRVSQDAHLEDVSAVLTTLRVECGMARWHPCVRPRDGSPVDSGSTHSRSFLIIEGTTAFDTRVRDAHWRQIAEVIAALHTSSDRCDVSVEW